MLTNPRDYLKSNQCNQIKLVTFCALFGHLNIAANNFILLLLHIEAHLYFYFLR